MPAMDLSALTTLELKRLLRAARSRHDGALVDRVEWAIAERAALASRMGVQDAPPDAVAPDPEADAADDPDQPDPPEPPVVRTLPPELEALVFKRPAGPPGIPALKGIPLLGVGLAAGSLFTAGLFWAANGTEAPRRPAKVERPALRVMTARPVTPAPRPTPPAPRTPQASGADAVAGVLAPESFPPPPPPEPAAPDRLPAGTIDRVVTEAEPQAQAAETPPPAVVEAEPLAEPKAMVRPEPAVTKPPAAAKTQLAAKKQAASKAQLAAKKTTTSKPAPAPEVRLAKVEPTPASPAPRDACSARSPTPADRMVCRDLSLKLFDLELREAYAEALDARVDPVLLGAGQNAWKRTRDRVADPDRMARLYHLRIRELHAAAAQAKAADETEGRAE